MSSAAPPKLHSVPLIPAPWPGDIIDSFLEYTEPVVSPPIFRLWAAIGMVAGALERRVWLRQGHYRCYPNLYTLLVAPPAVGKFVVEIVRDIWRDANEPGTKLKAFHVSPNSMTKAALLDTLGRATSIRLVAPPERPDGPKQYEYHSLLVAAEEFAVLLPAYDIEFVSVLNDIYNNKSKHEESRRHGPVRELEIPFPQLNILGGIQPTTMATLFPEDIWQSGIARRFIMVYSNEEIRKPLWDETPRADSVRAGIVDQLAGLSRLFGPVKITREAMDRLSAWHDGGHEPRPQHSKLSSYVRARIVHVQKLCIVASVSRDGGLGPDGPVITLGDVERAMAWLFQAEALMPDIFREMVGKSDTQVLEELWHFLQQLWIKSGRKPDGVPGHALQLFLSQRVPSDKVAKIMELAERASIVARVAGTEGVTARFLPRPKNLHGLE